MPTAPPPTTPPPPERAPEASDDGITPPPAPPQTATTPPKSMSRAERRKAEQEERKAAEEAARRREMAAQRAAREKRYLVEIADARRSLAEQKEMWLGLVRDSEKQKSDLEAEIAEADRAAAKLRLDAGDRREETDARLGTLTELLVTTKMQAAELNGEVDMLQHHIQLVRRQSGGSGRGS